MYESSIKGGVEMYESRKGLGLHIRKSSMKKEQWNKCKNLKCRDVSTKK